MASQELQREDLIAFADVHRESFEADLKTLVEIPSISPSPDHREDQDRVAKAAAQIMRDMGVQAQIIQTPGSPVVHGVLGDDPSCPTVTVYNHMDVQPANEPEWKTDPFEMITQGDTYRGRGTTDDKGPALTALYGAVAARQAGVPINIKLLWETEEEIGSPNLAAGLQSALLRFATDSVVVSDTIWLTRGKPSTPVGLRGLQSFSVHLETADHDLHSGLVGGAARNPLTELGWLIGEMVDARTGEVKIPGFYKNVEDPSLNEAREFAVSGFSIDRFMADHELKSLRMTDPLDVMIAIWTRPTLEVHGLVGGYSGPGIKSAVPARAEAKLSCRIVPDQTCEEVLQLVTEFIHARIPDAKIVPHARLEPYKGLTHGGLADAVRDAYHFGFGQRAAFTREGGSIGAVPIMADVLNAPISFLGLSLPEHGYHAPNENFDWEQARGGMPMFARYFENLANAGKQT